MFTLVEILLEKISHIYPGEKAPAVKDVTLRVPNGELAALLGPSGCGKTTLMNIISGLTDPTTGRVYFDTVDVTEVPPEARNVAMVFQFVVTYDMSVYGNIAFPLKARRYSTGETKKRVAEIAELLGLTPYLKMHAKKLDAGNRQLVAIARALIREPNVFLFDEPLTNLDPVARAKIRAKVKEVQKDLNQTMIYVTHDQAESLTLAEKIAVMNEGALIQYDDPRKLYDHPRTTFVAFFIGNPGMNLVDATLEGTNLSIGEFKYDVSEWVDILKARPTELVFGIRPEYIRLYKHSRPNAVKSLVTLTESTGNLNLVHSKVGNTEFRAKTSLFDISEGDEVYVEFPKEHVKIFDRKTGELIVG